MPPWTKATGAALLLALTCIPAHAQFAAAMGAYLVAEGEACRSSEWLGAQTEDFRFQNVCIPKAIVATVDSSTVMLAVAELTNPSMLEHMLKQQALGRLPVDEAYEVEVERRNDDIYDLTDGTVLRALEPTYVGYVGYHEEAILYRDGPTWHFCVTGTSLKVEVLRVGTKSYNRDSLSGSKEEIAAMEPCD
jgi:hypothetical protein